MDTQIYLQTVGKFVEAWYVANFNAEKNSPSAKLYESMRYSLDAGGKRLRPALLIMAYNVFDNQPINKDHPALPYAAAVEMLHTYSLIHDDLPGMDNDDLRRGKPTNHKVYGEATAILAGDGLLTKAFEIFFSPHEGKSIPCHLKTLAGFTLAKSVGPDGMVGGQYVDIVGQGANDEKLLKYIHDNKTAIFIAASLACGAILAGAEDSDVKNMHRLGMICGLAFQIVDDILDVISTSEKLGKPAGSDEKLDKLTFPKLFGIDGAKKKAEELLHDALKLLEPYGEKAEPLKQMAVFIGNRSS